jgi:polyisoprenoid-binding protein YceI
VDADRADLARSRVVLRFEARRLAVVPGTEPAKDVPEVETRMRGPAVLDVERHPDIAFASTAVSADGPPPPGGDAPRPRRLRVKGTLTLKGRATEIEVPLEVHTGADGLRAGGTVELKLRTLGIEPPSVAGVVKVADRFTVSFEIHARPVAP